MLFFKENYSKKYIIRTTKILILSSKTVNCKKTAIFFYFEFINKNMLVYLQLPISSRFLQFICCAIKALF